MVGWLQRGGSDQAGWIECGPDEGVERQVREVCFPSGGQPHDETHHQLSLQEQGGQSSCPTLLCIGSKTIYLKIKIK